MLLTDRGDISAGQHRPYASKITMDFLIQNSINVLPWTTKNILETNLIDACANASLHLNH